VRSDVEYVRHVRLLTGLPFGVRVVISDVVRRRLAATVATGRRRVLQVLIVPQGAAAPAALEHGGEAAPELPVEERVQHRIDAAVGRAQPLCDRRGNRKEVLFPRHQPAAQLDPGEYRVQRQPGSDEQHHHHGQHLHHLHLALLLDAFHAGALVVSGYGPPPHLHPDHHVTQRYGHRGNHVAQAQVAQQKVQVAVQVVRPHLQAQFQVRGVLEYGHHVEEQRPRYGDRGRRQPDDGDDVPSSTSGDLTLERVPDGQEPVDKTTATSIYF